MEDNPYRRPVRPQVLRHMDFEQVLGRADILTYSSLAANRLLLNIYESDLVLLPAHGLGAKENDFRLFYAPEIRVHAEMIRPTLERHVFGFLGAEIDVSGTWTKDALAAYFTTLFDTVRSSDELPLVRALRGSSNPRHAALTLLIQLAGDFLSEASAMTRNVLGKFDQAQSELFKIVIDELGYGVHRAKHSTMFERTMSSVGLEPEIHTYWQFYLTSSLLLNNYFHFLCKDHAQLFRYLGALFYVETMFRKICRDIGDCLAQTFGGQADIEYFREHAHIDKHHGEMVLNKVLLPLIDRHGTGIIPDMVRGFEEAKLVGEIADEDFAAQVAWSDNEQAYKALHDRVYANVLAAGERPPVQQFVEPRGELSVTHVHDGDELCHIVSGVMRFVTGHERSVLLHAGEGTVIERRRLHGAIIESEECVYDIHSIGDRHRWL
jgi:mannose-6-phosphate isomerase-like protein (cupin superfamily)